MQDFVKKRFLSPITPAHASTKIQSIQPNRKTKHLKTSHRTTGNRLSSVGETPLSKRDIFIQGIKTSPAPSQSRDALCGLIRPSSVLFIGKYLQPGADVRAVFGVVAAELEEIDVALRHIHFDRFGIAGAELPVAVQKRLQLGLGPQEFLPRPPEHRPGDIEFLISISGKLKIQNAADLVLRPEDIRIVEIPMAKTRVGRFLCGWKSPLRSSSCSASNPASGGA